MLQGQENGNTVAHRKANYKWEATTLEGFIQQLAVGYVARRYFFYVTGRVSERLTAEQHDQRLLAKFEVAKSKWSRYRRRKRKGPDGRPLANVQYLRYRKFWVLLATAGHHRFFDEHGAHREGLNERRQYHDVRVRPICFGGYSIGWRKKASVRISPQAYRDVKAYFLKEATRSRSTLPLEREFRQFPFEPYGGVIRQLLAIYRAVNRARKTAGLSAVPQDCLRLRRRVVKPFEPVVREPLALAA